jgi:hypothetical protein
MRNKTFQESDMTNLIFDRVSVESGREIMLFCRGDCALAPTFKESTEELVLNVNEI